MNLSLFGSSNPNKILKSLMEQPCNNYCVDCNEPSASNVDCTHYTFVCVSCSAIHREIGDKIKSVGVSTFTPEEIEKLKETSNDEFNNTWMSGFKRGDQPLLPASNEEARRAFIFAKYRQKKWHKDSPKMSTQSHRTMFPTEEDDSDNENMNTRNPKNDYYSSNLRNKPESDDYDEDDDNHGGYNNYNGNQRQMQQSFRRGNPFGNSSQDSQQQQQNLYYQNSYQPQQNAQYLQNNLDQKTTKSSTQLNASSKNAPFQRHKSTDHSHKKFQQQFQPQNQIQNQPQPQFQQSNQNDLLIDFNTPQPQNSNMQSAIDDIFGPTAQQPQYQQTQQNVYQQPSYQQYQQQIYQQPSYQQSLQPQPQPQYQPQSQYQSPYQQSPPVQQQNSFPHKKQNQKKSKQTKQTQQTQQAQNNAVDNIIDFSYTSNNQPQNQQTDDLLNFDIPNDAPSSHLNDDELLNFSNAQISAEQQQMFEKRRQLKEAMVNMSNDDLSNTRGNSNIEKLRNVGLGVQDSPTFMAKALIASGYCSQPANQPIQRMGMQPQNQMYYGGAYQGYQQNQYYKPQ